LLKTGRYLYMALFFANEKILFTMYNVLHEFHNYILADSTHEQYD